MYYVCRGEREMVIQSTKDDSMVSLLEKENFFSVGFYYRYHEEIARFQSFIEAQDYVEHCAEYETDGAFYIIEY